MPEFGFIKSFDRSRAAGTIIPEDGGDALPFRLADMQQQGQVPQVDARFGYDTHRGDGGHRRAINLHPQEDERERPFEEKRREQARNQRG